MTTFTLNESKFDAWVTESLDLDTLIEVDVEQVEIGPLWNPGEDEPGSDIYLLVSYALTADVIVVEDGEKGIGDLIQFAYLPPTDYEDYPAYTWEVPIGGGLMVREYFEDLKDIGDPELRGKAAALAVLQEAVSAGNRINTKLHDIHGGK